MSRQNINMIAHIDATTWLIQKRLIAICQTMLPKHHKNKEMAETVVQTGPKNYIHPGVYEFEQAGHTMHVNPGRTSGDCIKCGQTFTLLKGKREKYYCSQYNGLHRCQGIDMWDGEPDRTCDPWVLTPNEPFVLGDNVIHISHTICWWRGVFYCAKCAYYSHKRVRKLAEPCRMKPPSIAAWQRLKSIREGICPLANGKPWPLPLTINLDPNHLHAAMVTDIP